MTPITTTTELEALPVGTFVLDCDGDEWHLETRWHTDVITHLGIEAYMPLTVPHSPGQSPDPSPTVLALAQALAERDGHGQAFTSATKSETLARFASDYIRQAEQIAKHLPASPAPECDHAALVRNLAQSTVLSLASAEAVVHAATTWTAPAPTVKPGRDEVARLICPGPWTGEHYFPFRGFGETRTTAELIESDRDDARTLADAVLAILPGKTEQEVRAQALRDAADALAKRNFLLPRGHAPMPVLVDYLRVLADEEVR